MSKKDGEIITGTEGEIEQLKFLINNGVVIAPELLLPTLETLNRAGVTGSYKQKVESLLSIAEKNGVVTRGDIEQGPPSYELNPDMQKKLESLYNASDKSKWGSFEQFASKVTKAEEASHTKALLMLYDHLADGRRSMSVAQVKTAVEHKITAVDTNKDGIVDIKDFAFEIKSAIDAVPSGLNPIRGLANEGQQEFLKIGDQLVKDNGKPLKDLDKDGDGWLNYQEMEKSSVCMQLLPVKNDKGKPVEK